LSGFFLRMVTLLLAQRAQLRQVRLIFCHQVEGRIVPRPINALDNPRNCFADLPPQCCRFRVTTLGQPPRFAQNVRQTA